MIVLIAISGCVTVAPHWSHEFDGVGNIEGDTIRVVQDSDGEPSERWIAIRSYDLEGWFLMQCKDLPAKYDRTMTTESGIVKAWFMKTPASPERNPTFQWHLPAEVFRSFRKDPHNILFHENVLPLEGTVRIRGNDDTIDLIEAELKSRDNPGISFRGSVTRHWHLFQVNFVII